MELSYSLIVNPACPQPMISQDGLLVERRNGNYFNAAPNQGFQPTARSTVVLKWQLLKTQ